MFHLLKNRMLLVIIYFRHLNVCFQCIKNSWAVCSLHSSFPWRFDKLNSITNNKSTEKIWIKTTVRNNKSLLAMRDHFYSETTFAMIIAQYLNLLYCRLLMSKDGFFFIYNLSIVEQNWKSNKALFSTEKLFNISRKFDSLIDDWKKRQNLLNRYINDVYSICW